MYACPIWAREDLKLSTTNQISEKCALEHHVTEHVSTIIFYSNFIPSLCICPLKSLFKRLLQQIHSVPLVFLCSFPPIISYWRTLPPMLCKVLVCQEERRWKSLTSLHVSVSTPLFTDCCGGKLSCSVGCICFWLHLRSMRKSSCSIVCLSHTKIATLTRM